MRKLALIVLFIGLPGVSLMAQTPDSLKKTVAKPPQLRTVGGVQMSSANDLLTNLSKSKNHNIFVSLIIAAGLGDALKTPGAITVFAPTDDAFKKVPLGTVDTLMKPTHLADLTKQLNYCVVQGKLRSADIAKLIKAGNGEATIQTLSGVLKAKINGDRNIVLTDETGNQAVITQFDIPQSNGLLLVVNAVLVPKPN